MIGKHVGDDGDDDACDDDGDDGEDDYDGDDDDDDEGDDGDAAHPQSYRCCGQIGRDSITHWLAS